MTREQIKALWKENGRKASEAGTKMHYDIECFYNNMEVDNKSTEFEYFLRFSLILSNITTVSFMEYPTIVKIAATIDRLTS